MAIGDATTMKSSRARSISRSKKADLQFPVGRIARFLKDGKYAKRVSADAPVYLAAVLEYLAAEVLELAGDRAKDGKKKRILPTHINLAVRRDEELLDKVFDKVITPNAATVPYIQRCLRKEKDKWL